MKNRNVVIIDNDPEDLERLESVIEQVDPQATCLSFVFADEAVRLLRDEISPPEFIFIDVNMRRLTGPECLKILSEDEKLKACKIVMFSVVMPPLVGESFIQRGAFAYYQKPISESLYLNIVGNIFRKQNANQPLTITHKIAPDHGEHVR